MIETRTDADCRAYGQPVVYIPSRMQWQHRNPAMSRHIVGPADEGSERPFLTVVRNCGHLYDMTDHADRAPAVGDETACWSSCDRGGRDLRRVVAVVLTQERAR